MSHVGTQEERLRRTTRKAVVEVRAVNGSLVIYESYPLEPGTLRKGREDTLFKGGHSPSVSGLPSSWMPVCRFGTSRHTHVGGVRLLKCLSETVAKSTRGSALDVELVASTWNCVLRADLPDAISLYGLWYLATELGVHLPLLICVPQFE